MPIPEPRKDESEKAFIKRFMTNREMMTEYPLEQRLAIAYSLLRNRKV